MKENNGQPNGAEIESSGIMRPEYKLWLPREKKMIGPQSIFSPDLNTPDAIVLPWSGLSDINGVKIFDSDIVAVDYKPIQRINTIACYYPKDGCWIMIHPSFVRTVTEYKRLTKKVIKENNVLVVGNIFQNADISEEANSTYQWLQLRK